MVMMTINTDVILEREGEREREGEGERVCVHCETPTVKKTDAKNS